MVEKNVDACCLINVYASGKVIEILDALGKEVYIPVLVKSESLFIRQEDEQDRSILVPKAISLSEALAAGVIRECSLASGQETEEFVRLAAALDDGEAMCIALAKCRGWIVATDDHKALRVARSENVQTITTPEMIKHWADSCSIEAGDLCGVVNNIERYARFTPRRTALLRQWWETVRVSR